MYLFSISDSSVWRNHKQLQQPGTSSSWWPHCCWMSSHPSTSICCKSASVVELVSLVGTTHPSWSHKCSVVLRSGHPILSTPRSWRWSLISSLGGQRCHLGGQSLVPRLWRYRIATGCRILSRYLCTEIASDDDKPRFSGEGDAETTPSHYLHRKMLLCRRSSKQVNDKKKNKKSGIGREDLAKTQISFLFVLSLFQISSCDM